jgi:hypothetical protein
LSASKKKRWENSNVELRTVVLSPTRDGEENETFFEATPAGIVELGAMSEEAFSQFEPGKIYYLEFTLS